ncbi:FAD-dependent monooxygenase [Streptomyces lavendulae]|uniref:FAD-dependent monooxygenase n=1 Tax=Streptomyces lavendulae TaxID=1914 RepID=UPI0036B7DCA1
MRTGTDTDVVVAGGGPVGLMLACELRLGGARVVLVERRTDVDPTIKAGSINTPTAEAFHRRGMLPAIAEVQQRALEQFRTFMRDRPGARPPEAPRAPRPGSRPTSAASCWTAPSWTSPTRTSRTPDRPPRWASYRSRTSSGCSPNAPRDSASSCSTAWN